MDNPGDGALVHQIHWHVLLVHFPISFFIAAFGFQILHLFMAPYCFELATNAMLIGGAFVMIPTVLSGWSSWKNRYKGAPGTLFKRKIVIGFIMLFLSALLAAWRTIGFGFFNEAGENPQHLIYLAGNTLLIVGAIAEGFYGGRLNHR